jgi:hypothetical protein
MSQAGRKKADEIKKRIIAACQEAGLAVQGAKYYLRREYGDRFVQVSAASPDGPCCKSAIDVRTAVGLDGDWPGVVDIASFAADDSPDANQWGQPVFVMRSREHVPLRGLVAELRKTVEERAQVVAAIRLGIEGPYAFEHARWEAPPDAAEDSDALR